MLTLDMELVPQFYTGLVALGENTSCSIVLIAPHTTVAITGMLVSDVLVGSFCG